MGYRIITVPGKGDCFFHCVAYFRGNSANDVEAARKVRQTLAEAGYARIFGDDSMPFETLAEVIAEAEDGNELERLEVQGDPTAQELHELYINEAGPSHDPANGKGCHPALWLLWLWHDITSIAKVSKLPYGPWARDTHRAYTYTLWGDALFVARLVQLKYGLEVRIYDATNIDTLDNAKGVVNLYHHENNHFDVAVWKEEEYGSIGIDGPSESDQPLRSDSWKPGFVEDWHKPGCFHEIGSPECKQYIHEACERGHPLELAWIKPQFGGHEPEPESGFAGAVDVAVHHAVTTLLYRAQRHDWDGPRCRGLRHAITALVPAFGKYTEEDFSYYIYGEELKQGTYWGDLVHDYEYDRIGSKAERTTPQQYSFDDSDDEEEEEGTSGFERERPKRTFRTYRRYEPDPEWVRRRLAKLNKLPFTQTKGDLTKYLRTDWSTGIYRNSELAHDPLIFTDEQILGDLVQANEILVALQKGRLTPEQAAEEIGGLRTKFAIAQYRGIAYNTTTFSAMARRTSLEAIEVGLPVLCSAAFKKLGASPGDYYAGAMHSDTIGELYGEASRLRVLMLQKRESGPIEIGGRTYANHALALHDFYTNHYDDFLAELGRYFEALKTEQRPSSPPPIWAAFKGLEAKGIPFVSTGDIPQHALRYAYGSKYYPGQQDQRLRPRWRKSGKSEFPYAGKVYTALFSLEEYLREDPHHIPSLNNSGHIHIKADIVGELETSFAGLLPREVIVAEHVARYPSFPCDFEERDKKNEKGWQQRDLIKYGLTKEEYEAFWEIIASTAPHSEGRKRAKVSLGNWLIHYHEVRMVEIARRMAERQDRVLIYRDSDTGLFTLQLAEHTPRQDVELVDFLRSGSIDRQSPSGLGNTLDVLPPDEGLATEKRVSPLLDGIYYEQGRVFQRLDAALWSWLSRRYVLHPTPTDGNAVFHAIVGGLSLLRLEHLGPSHASVRMDAVDYLRRRDISPFGRADEDNRLFAEYCREMSVPAEHPRDQRRWGSDLEIEAAASVFNVNICIYSTSYVQLCFQSDVDRILTKLKVLVPHEERSPRHRALVMATRGVSTYLETFGPGDPKELLRRFFTEVGAIYVEAMGYAELCGVIGDPRCDIQGGDKEYYMELVPKDQHKNAVPSFFKATKTRRVTSPPYVGLGQQLTEAQEGEDKAFRDVILGMGQFKEARCCLVYSPFAVDEVPTIFLYHTGGTHFFWLKPRD